MSLYFFTCAASFSTTQLFFEKRVFSYLLPQNLTLSSKSKIDEIVFSCQAYYIFSRAEHSCNMHIGSISAKTLMSRTICTISLQKYCFQISCHSLSTLPNLLLKDMRILPFHCCIFLNISIHIEGFKYYHFFISLLERLRIFHFCLELF